MKIIKITTLAFLLQLAIFPLLSYATSAMTESIVYVHTVRNAPILKTSNSSGVLEKDTKIAFDSFEIKCDENQNAFLVFSNRTVLEISKNTDVKIVKYKHVPSKEFDFYEEYEKTRSTMELDLKEGTILSCGLKLRPTSSFKVSTPFGKLDIKSTQFIISVNKKELSIMLLSGQATFLANNGKSDFLQKQQRGQVFARTQNASYPMSIDYMTSIEEKAIRDRFKSCKTAFETVEFFADKNGKLSARRIVSKEFLNRPTQ